MSRTYRLLLFDQDGTLTFENKHYHQDLSTLPAYPFTGETLRGLYASGYKLVVVTNQSGIAREYFTMEEVQALHKRFCTEWQLAPEFYICPHHPDEGCRCRKPEPYLLQQAMSDHKVAVEECLMIGDSVTDFLAAEKAGIAFALVLTGRGQLSQGQLPGSPAMVLNNIADLQRNLN